MTTDMVELRWCGTCDEELLFEQPDCTDGHGADCPEWVCVQCGRALLLGFLEVGSRRAGTRSHAVAAGGRVA